MSAGAGGAGALDTGELLKIWELCSKEISFDKTEDEDGDMIKVRGIAPNLHGCNVLACSLKAGEGGRDARCMVVDNE